MFSSKTIRRTELPLLSVSAPEIVSGMSGESEAKIRELFVRAQAAAPWSTPQLLSSLTLTVVFYLIARASA
jgi:AAA+ superfamily predicted ATPase